MRHIIRDDFNGVVISGGATVQSERTWVASGSSPGTPAAVTSEAGAPGILRVPTGGSSGNNIALALSSPVDLLVIPDDCQSFKIRLRFSHTTSLSAQWGLGNAANSTLGTEGLFFSVDTATDTNVRVNSRNGGVSTTTNTNRAIETVAFTSYEFVRVTASIWQAFIIHPSLGRFFTSEHTTNLPAPTPLTLITRIQTATAAARHLEVDLIEAISRDFTLR